MAYVTATVTVWDRDPAIAAEKLRLVEKVIQGRDFTVIPEGMNAIEAWLGSLPGHTYANVRQPPISTINLAHLIPLSAVWAGAERDEHFGAPPLLYGKTEGSTPFRFSLHVGDVGHTLIVGPTGAGKSVLLALMAMQFRRYEPSAGLRLRLRRQRSAPPRSAWAATGRILAGCSPTTARRSRAAPAAGADRRSRRARLGG
jgi:type IV secretory pathway VirB4 component